MTFSKRVQRWWYKQRNNREEKKYTQSKVPLFWKAIIIAVLISQTMVWIVMADIATEIRILHELLITTFPPQAEGGILST